MTDIDKAALLDRLGTLKAYRRYLKYVVRHKWYVFLHCCSFGIPWLGIVHDWSKLRPSEFIPYANYFGRDIKRGRDKTGYYNPADTGDAAFETAWLLHQHRNAHHWQHWCLVQDDDAPKIVPMPMRYCKEMVADWRGAGQAQGTPDTLAWYSAHKDKMFLAPETRKWVEAELGLREVV